MLNGAISANKYLYLVEEYLQQLLTALLGCTYICGVDATDAPGHDSEQVSVDP